MPLYRGSQKIKDLYVGGQKIKEAWTMIDGEVTKVYSATKTPTVGAALTTIPGAASASFTAAVPSAGNVGDLILMVVAHEGTLTSFPSDWTRHVAQIADNWGRVAVFTKIRAESEPSVALTFGQAKRHVVRIMSITGGKSVKVADLSAGGTGTVTGGPGITTTTPKNLIVSAIGWKSDTSSPTLTWSPPYTLLFKDSGAAVSSSVTTLALATTQLDEPGTIGESTITSTLASTGGKGIATIAISPT